MKFWTSEEWWKIGPSDLCESDCPFCKDKSEYTIWKWEYFFITHAKYPYNGLENHLLAIPYRHVRETSKLTHEEFASFREVEIFMKDFYKNEENYFSFIRETKGCKSVAHLHYHFLPGRMRTSSIQKMLEKQQKERS